MKIENLYIAVIIMDAIACGLNLSVALLKHNIFNLISCISFAILTIVFTLLYFREIKNN